MKRFLMACTMALTALSATAEASGFIDSDMSASGMGVANAFVASADDVSAAAYNPAALAWQDGVRAMVGMNIRYRHSSVAKPVGIWPNSGGAGNGNHLYASWMPHDSDLGIAAGLSTPYDLDNNWGNTFGAGAGLAALRINRVNLDIIYAVNSTLAVAAGGDWYIANGDVSQGGINFHGTDKTGFGGHASLKWKFQPAWMLGATYRSGASVALEGGNRKMSVKLPDEVKLGIAHDIADAVRLELDGSWTRWSRMKSLNVVSTAGVPLVTNTLNLKDAFGMAAGLTWYWRQNTQIRFGYAYDQGANREAGLHPVVADQSGHMAALGMGGDMFGIHMDLAYAYTFYPDQTATGAFAGTYRDRRHSLAFSVSKDF